MNIEEYKAYEGFEWEAAPICNNVIKTRFPIKKVVQCEIVGWYLDRESFILNEGRLPKNDCNDSCENTVKAKYMKNFTRYLLDSILTIVGDEITLDGCFDGALTVYVTYQPDLLIRKAVKRGN